LATSASSRCRSRSISSRSSSSTVSGTGRGSSSPGGGGSSSPTWSFFLNSANPDGGALSPVSMLSPALVGSGGGDLQDCLQGVPDRAGDLHRDVPGVGLAGGDRLGVPREKLRPTFGRRLDGGLLGLHLVEVSVLDRGMV